MFNCVNKVLLASHGTMGAQAAEQKAYKICSSDTHIMHLVVIPEFWRHMLGDDWLNNYSTRRQFCDYLETELDKEIGQHVARVQSQLEKLGISNEHEIVLGNPEECLIKACKHSTYDLVIIGSPRPKSMTGLHSRMATKPMRRKLTTPLLMVPHPNAC